MKKLKLSSILVCIVMLAAVCFSGCSFFEDAQYLTVKEMPKTQFTQDESWTLTEENLNKVGFSFTIQVTKGSESTTYVFGREAKTGETAISMGEGATQFSIKGFDLSKTGSHLATIKIGSANGSFQYEVIGNGKGTSESDAIKISTVEDFYKMEAWDVETKSTIASKKDVYYKLTNNIDFGVVNGSILNAFSGHLNGNGYTVSAVFSNAGDPAAIADTKGSGLVFIVLDNAELKNIDFNLTGGDNAICRNVFNKVVMTNVDRYGSSEANKTNRALFVTTFMGYNLGGGKMMVKNAAGEITDYTTIKDSDKAYYVPFDITMTECDNYANMSSIYQTASIYFAYGLYLDSTTTGKVTLSRCNNYGVINGENSTVYFGNGSFANAADSDFINNAVISVTDCYNYGSVKGATTSVMLTGGKDKSVEDYSCITVKAGAATGNAAVAAMKEAELDNEVKGALLNYTFLCKDDNDNRANIKLYFTKDSSGKLSINHKAIEEKLGKSVAYYRMSAWYEAYIFERNADGSLNGDSTNTKQQLGDVRIDNPATDLVVTDYYFVAATTGEKVEETSVGWLTANFKNYAFQEYESRSEIVKLKDTYSKVEFRLYCYDANNEIIGYASLNSSNTIA